MSAGPGDGVGLSEAEVRARRERDGPNRLPSGRRVPAWRQLASEMGHFFAILLWVAAGLAIVAGMPQLGVAIIIVIVLNGTFAFVQERRAEHAAEQLRLLLPRRCTVIRGGATIEVDAEELVVDDIVVLGEGDRVSADLELTDVRSLAVDTSSLTGESVPDHPLESSVVHAGSFVVEGEATAKVIATGPRTRLAAIASLSSRPSRSRTPLRRELERVSRLIAVMAVGVGVAFFFLSLALGSDPSDGFLFAVGVTVALVPEGLLPTVTLSLAIGAQRMASHHALVRHLEAAETLGSTTFICTDKTGTLTRNEMEVIEVWTPEGTVEIVGEGYAPTAAISAESTEAIHALEDLALTAVRCGTGRVVEEEGSWLARGDPMEAAIDALARRVGVDRDADETARPEIGRFPFDARRRRMSVIVEGQVMVKGAPDSVLALCGEVGTAWDEVHRLAERGLRVLAVASRVVGCDGSDVATADGAESGLTLLGLVALEDPPRHGAAAALAACRRAGIRVAMVTGDHPATAASIAREVGLAIDGSPVVVGADLPDDDEALGALIDHDGIVIARVTPEDKLRIATVLRTRGHVVAMTGDGVNDAPALRESAIGIAMGRSGTDVARDAADLVLLDDDFATIVAAIEQGRSTFANIRRFLTYYLAGNVAELTPFVVWALSGARIPLAIGVLQILALDVGTSVLPALALGAEPPSPYVLDGPQRRRHLLTKEVFIRSFAVLGPTIAALEMIAFFAAFTFEGWHVGQAFPTGHSLAIASGAAFSAVVLGQVANAFACRSTIRPAWRIGATMNRLLVVAVGIEIVMLIMFLLPPIAGVLDQSFPSPGGLLVAAMAMPAVVVVDALQKWHRHRPRR